MTTHIIALEGGATHTRAGLYDAAGSLVREHEGGPANPIAYGIRTCVHTVCTIIRDLLDTVPAEEVNGFAAFAGAADSGIQQELAAAIGTQAGLHSMTVTTDLHALLHANAGAGTGMLVISGTGAAVLARNRKGKFLRTGGWGTLLGDEGSGYAIAAAALRALNDTISVEAHAERLSEENAHALLAGVDLVLDGTDDFATRFAVNAACHALGVTLISGAVGRWSGQVAAFAPQGPCYRCFVPSTPPDAETCERVGIVGALTGIIGSIMALEAVKHLADAGETLTGRILLFDGLNADARTVKLARDPACPVCGHD